MREITDDRDFPSYRAYSCLLLSGMNFSALCSKDIRSELNGIPPDLPMLFIIDRSVLVLALQVGVRKLYSAPSLRFVAQRRQYSVSPLLDNSHI